MKFNRFVAVKLLWLGMFLLSKCKLFFFALLLCSIFSAALTVFLPTVMGGLTTSLHGGTLPAEFPFDHIRTPLAITALFAACGLLKIIMVFSHTALNRIFMNTLAMHLKSEIHNKILTLDAGYHNRNDMGKNIFNIENSARVANSVSMMFVLPLATLVTLFMASRSLQNSMNSMQIPSWLISCFIPMLFLLPFLGYWIGTKINRAFANLRQKRISANEELMNSLLAPLEIQSMNAEKQCSENVWAALKTATQKANMANFLASIESQLTSFFILFFQVLIAFVIATFYLKDATNTATGAGPLITCITLIPILFNQIGAIIASYLQTQQAEPEITSVYNLLHLEPEIKDAPDAVPVSAGPVTGIRFENVSFSYDKNCPVLRDLSFDLPIPGITALAANFGEGKTTLLHLLSRIYEPDSGSILLNGRDLRCYTLASLRATVIRVSQQPLFIQGTLRKNFQLQQPDVTDEAITEACKKTGIWETFLQLSPASPLDFQLQLGAKNISGGQRRLLALARMLVASDAKILMLDEPTNGLDAQTIQYVVLPILHELKKEKVVILVDHNLNFLNAMADKLLILEQGRLVHFDSPENLLADPESSYSKHCREYNLKQKEKANAPA